MDNPLDQFRAAVMADPALQQHLAEPDRADIFEPRVLEAAARLGIPLTHADIVQALKPDPLGIASLLNPMPAQGAWPSRDWLPSRVIPQAGFAVDWAHFAGRPLDYSFFEDSRREAAQRPFNQLFRYRSDLDGLIDGADADALAPAGFIFHMSRCGSTLAAQMLAASPANIVASEPAPLDMMIQLPHLVPGIDPALHAGAVRAMALALGRRRDERSRRYFIKTDCWHTLAFPVLRAAFPDTPWVFLYRDPVEVLVSHQRMAGGQTVPELLSPSLFGLDPVAMHGPDYNAQVLASVCNAAIAEHARGGGIMINYRELPDAVFTRILPHFGVGIDADERALMQAATGRDAKDPNGQAFIRDSATKQAEASDAIRVAADTHFAGVYAKLEQLSASSPR